MQNTFPLPKGKGVFNFGKGGRELKTSIEEENLQEKMTEREKNLIDLIRKVGHGEVRVIIQDSCPIRVEDLKKSIKL
ncbi:Uncharacterized small protein [Anaerovirgula multivorans]|uniref:Uncharacterized small protein n=1 Tax=Anaerovirgula multivorans TaxID=312168 RepID=A0A239C8L8_9FIRM|nr:Uncharacterized small protein [Anaerovirgula multivorans]